MKIKSVTVTGLGLASMSLALVSLNSWAETNYEFAQVLESRPVYELVTVSTPQEQCWEEEIIIDSYARNSQSNTPLLVSTLIGGAIGNALGHNRSNKQVGAVLGAMLGRSIGRDIMRDNNRPQRREYQTVQRCDTVYQQHEEERLVGYDVTYLYNGQEYSVRAASDPGDQIRLRVSVQAVL